MKRVETGVVQFDDDWPGVFVRGDDCFFYSHQLEKLLASLPPEISGFDDMLARKAVQGLLNTLKASQMPVEEKDLQRIHRMGSDHAPGVNTSVNVTTSSQTQLTIKGTIKP